MRRQKLQVKRGEKIQKRTQLRDKRDMKETEEHVVNKNADASFTQTKVPILTQTKEPIVTQGELMVQVKKKPLTKGPA